MRSQLVRRRIGEEPGFRWRGGEPSRLEGLADAVFGFAITLLVVSLEVPRTFDELAAVFRGFPAFAACFALLLYLWYSHYLFFLRYALADRGTIALNAVLLFLVVFYIYPLKFLFSLLIDALMAAFGWTGGVPRETALREIQGRILFEDMQDLMVIYGAGFLAVSLVFTALYARALARRGELELDPTETHMTREHVHAHGMQAAIAVLSITLALLGHPALSGWSYGLIGPVRGVHAWRMQKQREALARA